MAGGAVALAWGQANASPFIERPKICAKAMDDPKLVAELLRKHNPYDAHVMGRRMLRD